MGQGGWTGQATEGISNRTCLAEKAARSETYHFLYFFFLLNFVFYSLFSFLVVCVYRTRSAPICHCTSVLCAMKTTLAPSGWWMMQSLSSDAIFLVVVPGNMTPPHHPLHPTSPHSKHWLFGNFAAAGAATARCFSDWCLCYAKLPMGQEWKCKRKYGVANMNSGLIGASTSVPHAYTAYTSHEHYLGHALQ